MARKRGGARRHNPLFGLGKVSARQVYRVSKRHGENLRGHPFRSVKSLWSAQTRTAHAVARRALP